ncbi:unnamed protein product [Allacma fusca]|uniref:Ion transport domain-containing protein n=1 Tax=Allacma fusca TaxID=39272 RepID=A0A8J2JIS6_9HEXA|nr:unnamed protein product [Allacma fusca]
MGNCCGPGPSTNPGAVLDRVISQASNDDDCLLYKLAHFKKGGELVEAYNIGGAIEVEKLVREQFGILMYKDGKGQIISRTEYLRWKFRNQKHVVIPVEASSVTDPLAKWNDHEACWQMQYRGSLGETLLHVLIICDTRLHTRLARILLKCFPKLALDVVEGEEYLGASCLHLAIAYNNSDLVHLLVECGAHLDQRATGSFFLPRDQQRLKPAKNTDYEGLAYLGEYPLAWAACMNSESVYNLLLEEGADPDWQDSFGNMILHMVVITDQLGMYGYALRHPRVVASNGITNYQGLTPLTLACRLGRASVFREMLELSCREFWRYSNITCSAYPLNALDTIMPDGRTNWNSALFMILAGSKEEHLDMLDGGIIQRLLEEKWKTFAQNQFLKRISMAMVHLMLVSIAVYLRPSDRRKSLLTYNDAREVIRMGFEVASLFASVFYLVFQQGEEIKNQGFITFTKQLPSSPPKMVFLVSNFCLLLCIPFRLKGDIKTEEAILGITMVGMWFFLMFFAGAIKLTGPFVTMVYSMITGDMLTFGIIFVIFLLGFSQSFYYLFKSHPNANLTLFEEYHTTWMALYQMTLGSYDYSLLSGTGYPNMSKAVFIIFMILVPILLLNMLIAMMGNTYSQVIERSEKEWIKQWAKLVVALERSVSQEDAKKYIQEYSIKLSGTDPSNEVRGVMVIKTKSKTRANQRKGAVSNWKRVGKVTINALKKRGMTGEEMRQIMWGHRNSICTPQNVTPRQQSVEIGMSPLVGAPVVDPAGLLQAGIDVAMDQIAFSSIDPQTGNTLTPTPPSQNPSLLSPTGAVIASTVQPVSITPNKNEQKLQQSTSVNTTAATVSSLSAPGTVATVSSSSSLTPTSPAGIIPSPTPTTSIVASHVTPDIEKSPMPQPKGRKRNLKFGLKPNIMIFSDERDLLKVNMDADDSESDEFYDFNSFATIVPQPLKPTGRKSITSVPSNLSSSLEETEDSRRSGDENDKQKKRTPALKSPGVVNFAFEPEEFPVTDIQITKMAVGSSGLSAGIILKPPQLDYDNTVDDLKRGKPSRPKTARVKAPKTKTKPPEPSSSTEALISEQSSSPPPSLSPESLSPPNVQDLEQKLLPEAEKQPVETKEEAAAIFPSKSSDSSDKEKEKKRKKKIHTGRSKSAKNGNKVEPSGSKSKQSGDEATDDAAEKPRPITANSANDRWSTQGISNMNNLVAWDRPEDDI